MRKFDFKNNPTKLLNPEIVQMVGILYRLTGNAWGNS